jgi:hypothetical protein
MHLLLAVSPLELPSGFALLKFSPSLCLSEPLSTVGRVRACAFSTQKLHGAAVCNVVHDVSFLLGEQCAPNKSKEKTAPLTFGGTASSTSAFRRLRLRDEGEMLWN